MNFVKLEKKGAVAILTIDRQEALNALRQAISKLDGADERDVGELMLRAAAFARARGVEPELALNAATDRLIDRFAEAEKR